MEGGNGATNGSGITHSPSGEQDKSVTSFAALTSLPPFNIKKGDRKNSCFPVSFTKPEQTGFEPAEGVLLHRFSKPTLSATQPPLQMFWNQRICSC